MSEIQTLEEIKDIDIVIAGTPANLKILVQNLPSAEFYAAVNDAMEAFRHESIFNVVDMRTGWKVDFIMLKSSPEASKARAQHQLSMLRS